MTSSPGQFAPSEYSVKSADQIDDTDTDFGTALNQDEGIHSHCVSPSEIPNGQVSSYESISTTEVHEPLPKKETAGSLLIASEIEKLVIFQNP